MAGAAAFIARLLGKSADEQYLACVFFFKRKDLLFVFKQNHRLGRDLGRDQVVRVFVKVSFLAAFHKFIDDAKDSFHRGVQNFFVQLSVTDGLGNLLVGVSARRRHLQIQAGGQTGHAVVHRSPVAYDKAVKTPLFSQNVREQKFVFAGKSSVDPVVRAHDCVGLGFLYGRLKGRKVNLAQSPFVHVGAGRHSAVLHRVCGKVLYAGSDVL